MKLAISNTELSTLIGDIYQSSLTGQWQPVLTKIMEYSNSNKAFFFLQELSSDTPLILELTTNFDIPQQALIEYQSKPLEDPCWQTTRLLTEGEFHYCNEFINLSTHKTSEYFNKVFVPTRTFHVLVGILCRDSRYESVYAVNRSESDKPYSIEDKNLFQLITPHFSRAMHIFKELRLYKNYSNISKSILDQQDKSILVCDQDGTVVIKNDYAKKQLANSSNIIVINNKIVVAEPANQKRLDYFIEQCATLAYREIGVQETLIIEQGPNETLLVTVSPLINRNAFNDIDVPCCLVTVKHQQNINWQNFEREFELTPRELQLIKAIYNKQKLNDLVEVFGVSYNTLRTHLQSIFKKAGVSSQTELLIKLNMF